MSFRCTALQHSVSVLGCALPTQRRGRSAPCSGPPLPSAFPPHPEDHHALIATSLYFCLFILFIYLNKWRNSLLLHPFSRTALVHVGVWASWLSEQPAWGQSVWRGDVEAWLSFTPQLAGLLSRCLAAAVLLATAGHIQSPPVSRRQPGRLMRLECCC